MNELMKQNPFESRPVVDNRHVAAGAVSIEMSRSIAEAKMKLQIAREFPRNQGQAYERIMQSCMRKGLAEVALYKYQRGGSNISDISIRLAEEMARCWGNLDYGLVELSNRDGESEMMAYCWDLESNTRSEQKFVVKHRRDISGGKSKLLSSERDIYEMTANMGARRLRARIMAIIPRDIQDAAKAQIIKTLAGNSDRPLIDRVRNMISQFNQLGVTAAHIEEYLGKKIEQILPEDFVDLIQVHNAIRDNIKPASGFFNISNSDKKSTKNITDEIDGEVFYDTKTFATLLANWRKQIDSGHKTPEQVMEFIKTKNIRLTDEQIEAIKGNE